MRIAALDLGTNTFLLLIAEVEGREIKRVVLDETRVTRLGQGVHQTRKFHPDALARAEECFAEFATLIKSYRCDKVVAVATSAARDVGNRDDFLNLGRKYNIPIHVITGDQEAEITFDGATAGLELAGSAVVIDVGGGSTEIIGRDVNGRLRGESVDVGSVRITELFLPTHPCPTADLQRAERHIKDAFARCSLIERVKGDFLLAVAGTPTTLTTLDLERDFSEESVNGHRLSLERIWQWRDRLAQMSVPDRQKLKGMQPQRADVLVAGATILASAVAALKGHEIIVSTRGVRYGVARAWASF